MPGPTFVILQPRHESSTQFSSLVEAPRQIAGLLRHGHQDNRDRRKFGVAARLELFWDKREQSGTRWGGYTSQAVNLTPAIKQVHQSQPACKQQVRRQTADLVSQIGPLSPLHLEAFLCGCKWRSVASGILGLSWNLFLKNTHRFRLVVLFNT